MTRSTRDSSIDCARGLATLAMIQTHAYDGWVLTSERSGWAFAIPRVIATLALPAFMVLTGVSAVLRAQRCETVRAARHELARRGWQLVVFGYAFSAACAAIDGALTPDVLLRADVLHALGLSSIAVALLLLRPTGDQGAVDVHTLAIRGAWLAAIVLALCPALSRLGAELAQAKPSASLTPLRYLAALAIDVPGITRMPLVPLFAWTAAGAAWAVHLRHRPKPSLWLGLACVVLGHVTLRVLTEHFHVPAARTSIAIYPNAVDLFGRALLLLALANAWSAQLRGLFARSLHAVGKHSLLLYVLHVPFCYGKLSWLAHRSATMRDASFALALLLLACTGVALILERRTPRARAQDSRAD